MMNSRNIAIFLIAFCLCANVSKAQVDSSYIEDAEYYDEQGRVYLIDVGLDFGFPLGTYGDNMESTGFGFGVAFLFQAKPDKNYFLGMDFFYHHLQNESGTYDDFVDGFLVPIESSVTTNLIGSRLVYRFYPDAYFSIFEPFLEAGLGIDWFITTNNLFDIEADQSFDLEFENSDIAFAFSSTIGVQATISDYAYANFKLSYSQGGKSDYLAIDDDLIGSALPVDRFRLYKTRTDFIRLSLGVTFAF